MHGYKKGYFIDETGRLFRDQTGYRDHYDTIPFEVEYGRDNFGTPLVKDYHSVLVDIDRAESVTLLYSVNGERFKNVGQALTDMNEFKFPFGTSGHNINYKYTHNDNGPGPIINGHTTFWSSKEGSGAAG
jgi:hypothetical protein